MTDLDEYTYVEKPFIEQHYNVTIREVKGKRDITKAKLDEIFGELGYA
jgi:hypothetical protein